MTAQIIGLPHRLALPLPSLPPPPAVTPSPMASSSPASPTGAAAALPSPTLPGSASGIGLFSLVSSVFG
uniref:Uncharacterized protein n=1 Tax=Oryza nivara TaxID=4536 RepID=A0A0E0GEU3_ORYNI